MGAAIISVLIIFVSANTINEHQNKKDAKIKELERIIKEKDSQKSSVSLVVKK